MKNVFLSLGGGGGGLQGTDWMQVIDSIVFFIMSWLLFECILFGRMRNLLKQF